ncbi:LpxL/LpxP family acyltransferase [Gilvimarinus japonicus]|uniref:Acyltransferase n=1 Tax=Gilvimarinus japonicus TaxID=1796469 RepID=A0ABV7HV36_9GAMM
MTDPHWSEARERGSAWGMQLLFSVYRFGGRILVYPVVCIIVSYFYLTRASVRRHSARYLARATGHKARALQVWRHHLAFARALMDRLDAWMGRIQRKDVDFPGHQTLRQLQADKKGGVLLGAHFGNLEMCRAVVENDGSLKLNVILHNANTAKFNKVVERASQRSGVRLIQVDDITPATAMMLKAKLDEGEFLILLADRLPPGNTQRYFSAPFLGAQARFPTGPFWLALLLDAPVFFMAGFDTGSGYRARLVPLREAGRVRRSERDRACQTMLADYIEQLEQLCRAYPLQWFNFFDYWGDERSAENSTRSDVTNEQ